GCRAASSAPAPAACGEAMEVPCSTSYRRASPPTAAPAARMFTPGAANVGASSSNWLGPRELNPPTTSSQPVSVTVWAVACRRTVVACGAVSTMWSRRAVPLVRSSMTAGIVVASSWAMLIGGPPNWLTTTTATAPAAVALPTFSSKVQSPRSTSATAPSNDPAGKAAQPRALPGATCPAYRISAVRSEASAGPGPDAAHICVSCGGTGCGPVTSTRWATARACEVAGTDAVQGPVLATVPGIGPSLPADAATKMPALNASRKARSTMSVQGLSVPLME